MCIYSCNYFGIYQHGKETESERERAMLVVYKALRSNNASRRDNTQQLWLLFGATDYYNRDQGCQLGDFRPICSVIWLPKITILRKL